MTELRYTLDNVENMKTVLHNYFLSLNDRSFIDVGLISRPDGKRSYMKMKLCAVIGALLFVLSLCFVSKNGYNVFTHPMQIARHEEETLHYWIWFHVANHSSSSSCPAFCISKVALWKLTVPVRAPYVTDSVPVRRPYITDSVVVRAQYVTHLVRVRRHNWSETFVLREH